MNIGLTLVSQAVAFFLFVWFAAKFVWPPLMGAIEARQMQKTLSRFDALGLGNDMLCVLEKAA